jgi:hypothetical protein
VFIDDIDDSDKAKPMPTRGAFLQLAKNQQFKSRTRIIEQLGIYEKYVTATDILVDFATTSVAHKLLVVS